MGEIEDIEWGIILANDIVDPEKSLELSKKVAPYVDAIKLGITTTMKPGTGVFKKTKDETGKILVADFKIADVGVRNKEGKWEGTNNKIVSELVSAGADYVICHTIIGTSSIQECVDTAHAQGGKILTLPYMTHKGADVFFDLPFPVDYAKEKLEPLGLGNVAKKLEELRTEKRRHKKDSHHWRLPYPTVSDAILLIGEEINVDGFIGPANKLDVLKDYRQLSQWKKVFCPGVGRQSTEPEEQQLKNIYEVLGIRSAAIIGSTIYKAADPAAAAAGYRKMRDPIVEHIEAMREC